MLFYNDVLWDLDIGQGSKIRTFDPSTGIWNRINLDGSVNSPNSYDVYQGDLYFILSEGLYKLVETSENIFKKE